MKVNQLENVRLVIWDLDNTFWAGTLTEGGYTYIHKHHDIVVELAERGIMSSICSNNSSEDIQHILENNGLWKYFIFPDISWGPKGQRIASIIDNVQLRPETVLFIDDNPMNLAEALHYAPGLQVADESIVNHLLSDPRVQGKPDRELTRLAQYKVLEEKKRDERSSGSSDNREFLRSSQIRVAIEYDVESHLDRAIELINRTNQLNFTKNRLPENIDEARSMLVESLRRYDTFAGLVHVSDKYGDYGFSGLFVLHGSRTRNELKHFCFSCRTLNMGIESWIYRRLGRPALTVPSDVLCDVVNDDREIDWIAVAETINAERQSGSGGPIDRLVLRGGCDLSAISHYIANYASECHVENHLIRDHREVRIDHSVFLDLALDGVGPELQISLEALGYESGDWTTALTRETTKGSLNVWVLSFWMDALMVLYREKQSGILVPFSLPRIPHVTANVLAFDEAYLAKCVETPQQKSAVEALKREFDFYGRIDEHTFRATMRKLAGRVTDGTWAYIVLGPESWTDPATGVKQITAGAEINKWIRDELGGVPNVYLLKIEDFVGADAPPQEYMHFERLVYMRIGKAIEAALPIQRL